jgi:hypothetical protein
MSACGLIRELDNLGAGELILPSGFGHVGEGSEKDVRRVGAAHSALLASDEEMPAAERANEAIGAQLARLGPKGAAA